MSDLSAVFVIDHDVVAIQVAGEVEVIRGLGPRSAKIMRSPRPMVPRLLAHFQQPSTGRAWLDTWGPAEQQSAGRLFQTFVDHAYLMPVAARDEPTPAARGEQDESDDVAQSILALTHRLRADMKVLGGLGDAPAGADGAGPRPASLLLACHRMLQRLRDQVGTLREEHVEAQLAALSSDARTRRDDGEIRLHLGCGKHLLPGWINIDIDGGDLRLDLRGGLPFASGTISAVYMGHVLEHLDYKHEALAVLQEVRRALRPGGLARVVVPNIASFMRAYVAGDREFFADFERLWERPGSDTLLSSFLHYAGAGGFPLVMDRHLFGYDADTLRALLAEAGFTAIRECAAGDSEIDDPALDYSWASSASASGHPFSLIMEARA